MNVLATEHPPEAEQPRQSSVWDYISPSRLNLWLRCPLAFKLRYIDGIKTPTSTSMFLGTVVHAGLEYYYRHRQCGVTLSPEQVTHDLDQQWESLAENDGMTFDSSDEETSLREQASRLVSTYLDQVPEDEPSPLTVETCLQVPLIDPFTGEDLGIPLLGVVDLVLGGEDGPTVIDFKTASKSNNPVEIIHEVQLSAYSYLFRETAATCEGRLEIRSLIKTKTPKIACHSYPPRTDQHLRRFFSLVRAYLDDLDQGRFVYRPGWGCGMCDYRTGPCAAWGG